MLSHQEARARVARGAAHLDVVRPGWFNRIDVGTLSLGSCEECIAAQLVRGRHDYPFTVALRQLGLYDRAAEHGMGLFETDYVDQRFAEGEKSFALLQDAWMGAIADRKCALAVARHDEDLVGLGC